MTEIWRQTPCREWQLSRVKGGYGRRKADGKMQLVHRIEWEMHNGPIPDGLCVLHRCDNPPCYEITHLWLGTQQENMDDRQAKGRTSTVSRSQGVSHANSRLTEFDVVEIRREYASGLRQREIAAKYGVGQPHVSDIITKKKWSHVQ